MIVGSNNTMSYLNDACMLLKTYGYFSRCQTKTIKEQYYSGVRFFDFHLRFDAEMIPIFVYGELEYDSQDGIRSILKWFNSMAEDEDIYVRISLDCEDWYLQDQVEPFDSFIEECMHFFPNIYYWFRIDGTDVTIVNTINEKVIDISKKVSILSPVGKKKEQDSCQDMLRKAGFNGIVIRNFV